MSREQRTAGQDIDAGLFLPLLKFFQRDVFDTGQLMEFILGDNPAGNIPRYRTRERIAERRSGLLENYRGFAFDAYVKYAIRRFAEETACPISPTGFRHGTLPNGYRFAVGRLGNVTFYESDAVQNVTEIDGLYEFGGPSDIVPVMFEVTYKYGRKMKPELKINLIGQLYDRHPYLCEIRQVKSSRQPTGLSGVCSEYRRFMFIPRRNLTRIANDLRDLANRLPRPGEAPNIVDSLEC